MDGRTDNVNRNWKNVALLFSIFPFGGNCFLLFAFIFSKWKFILTEDKLIFTQVIGRRQQGKMVGSSESQSQSSICSTPGQSSASNKISSDWPDPPDIPICSTEDEAASIYSDSGEHRRFLVTHISIFNEKTFDKRKIHKKKIVCITLSCDRWCDTRSRYRFSRWSWNLRHS